jgi:hypothetical protein
MDKLPKFFQLNTIVDQGKLIFFTDTMSQPLLNVWPGYNDHTIGKSGAKPLQDQI